MPPNRNHFPTVFLPFCFRFFSDVFPLADVTKPKTSSNETRLNRTFRQIQTRIAGRLFANTRRTYPLHNHKIYNGDTSEAAAYPVSGSLKEWQETVARYAAGNSRLCLAIGTALAAPLLAKLNEQNGGFHIYGDSSDGKTTAALVALSVFGNPQTLKMTWRGTDLGFSNAALARNDGLLVLDEISEAQPKTISKTTYSIINGKSKI